MHEEKEVTSTKPQSTTKETVESLGYCGKRSFNAGLRYCGMSDIDRELKTSDDLIALARHYGLDVYSHGRQYAARNEPVLVVYRDGRTATDAEYHAVFASDVAPWKSVYILIAGWDELRSRISPASTAPVVDGISWSALLSVLERLKSKTRNPDAEWYHGWNAAIQCLINDINARSTAAATAAPQHSKISGFRDLRPNWDSYGGQEIASEAIDIALRIAPLLPGWQPVPRSDGGIQFERGDDEICIDIGAAAPVEQQTFRNTKEAMLYAQRNNIPIVVPVGVSSTSAKDAAEEIRAWIGISGLVDGEGVNEVAAIIERHCFPVSEE